MYGNSRRRSVLLLTLPLLAACSDGGPIEPSPEAVVFASIDAGINHNCALTEAGTAYCWGDGAAGQIGTADLDICGDTIFDRTPCALRPHRVAFDIPFTSITAGGVHTCALDAQGRAYCWGSDQYGQVARGEDNAPFCEEQRAPCIRTPLRIGLSEVAAISAGGSHTCAIKRDGSAYCWGYGAYGRLGTGAPLNVYTPTPVAGDIRFRAIEAGGSFSCGLDVGGRAYCWGYNHLGQLGDGTAESRLEPVRVQTDVVFEAVTVGVATACGLTDDGTAHCWGANIDGELGTVGMVDRCDTYDCVTTPVVVTGGYRFTGISAGSNHICGTTADGGLCWGENDSWQLGTGDQDPRFAPTPLRRAGLRAASAGYDHTCALDGAGRAYCWGVDWRGRIGQGVERAHATEPTPVAPPAD
jgi:alpha-tubulin suppressor-like RCC1 family protein